MSTSLVVRENRRDTAGFCAITFTVCGDVCTVVIAGTVAS